MPSLNLTRPFMILSAAFLAVLGLATSFLPQEILQYAGRAPDPLAAASIQVAGAAYIGFALLNWSAKGTLLGGIYGRPIMLANFAHFAIAAIVLVKFAGSGHVDVGPVVGATACAVFAAWCGYILFGPGPRQP